MQLWRWRMEPSDFHTWRSTGSPLLSIVRAVLMWIAFDIERYEERGTRLAEYEIIGFSEDAGRGGEPHYGAVVLVTPRELYFVKFLVAVLKLAGGVGNEYRGENKRVVAVGRVRLDSEHVVR